MREKLRVLLIDDERATTTILHKNLVAHGYDVCEHTSVSKENVFAAIDSCHPDLIFLNLDWSQKRQGLEICKRVRAMSDLPPVFVLSERDDERDKVLALDLGADDFIVEPFSVSEVLARIRAALRHASYIPAITKRIVPIGLLHVDFQHCTASKNGEAVRLTPIEYTLLKIFFEHANSTVSKQMLLSQVWGTTDKTRMHSVHVYIAQLRHKIEPDPTHPYFLTTTAGGYCLENL